MKYYKSDVPVFVLTHLVPPQRVFSVPDDTKAGMSWTEVDAQGQPIPPKASQIKNG